MGSLDLSKNCPVLFGKLQINVGGRTGDRLQILYDNIYGLCAVKSGVIQFWTKYLVFTYTVTYVSHVHPILAARVLEGESSQQLALTTQRIHNPTIVTYLKNHKVR